MHVTYDDVRRMAHRQRRRFIPGETQSTTTLVDDVWSRVAGTPALEDSSGSLCAAARAMRQIISDLARRHHGHGRTAPQAGDREAVECADALWLDGGDERILALDEAVTRLSERSPRLADVVNCRFFAGYSDAETAQAVGLTEPAVRREWAKARAWLYREVGPDL
jgi:RNA polymerase sigma factor (TIGR02999 family)